MLALILLIVLASFAVWGVYQKEQESRALRQEAEVQLADLRQQEELLSGHITSLKSDRGKEAALREQYSVGREGEGLIVLVESDQPAPVPQESTMKQWVRKMVPFW